MPFNVGENVGPYRIVEQLGQGGMATVYKAYHASLDRYVAIKVLHPAFNQDAAFETRFQREARVVAKLEHPNIVPVYDYAEHEKRPYLVMKFIEGITLKARMEQGQLNSEEITKVVDAVGASLAYAHKHGVLHRDIKPSNVLLANDGLIYLADFGLARMAQAGESSLSSDSIMGTPQYISPEQAMGKSDLDLRTDLYSFGVMLYEMVVGKVPFSADTPFSIIHDHIYTPLPMPRKVNPSVPETVERVLLKALAKEREDRFEDATRLVESFKSAWNEAGVPIQGSDASVSQVVRSEEPTVAETNGKAEEVAGETVAAVPSKPKRPPWSWIGAGLVVILCLGFLAFIRNNRPFARLSQNNNGAATQPAAGEHSDLPEEVLAAQQYMEEHPNDIYAKLDLALALWEADMPRETFDVLSAVTEQAGTDEVDFYEDAGNEFADIEGWTPAALMYFQAMQWYHREGDIPDYLREDFHEAVYKGAERPEAGALLQYDNLGALDQPLSLIARARYALYNGHVDDGRVFLNQVKRLAPDLPEVVMLQAEFDRHDGNFADARDAARSLTERDETPDWLIDFADDFLNRTL